MELKHTPVDVLTELAKAFNCTLMELKQHTRGRAH